VPIQDQDGDVAVAGGMSTGRRDDGSNPGFTPGQVLTPELDTDVFRLHVVRQHLVVARASGDAVMSRQHAIVFDQRSRASHAPDDQPHDVVVLVAEHERQIQGRRQVGRRGGCRLRRGWLWLGQEGQARTTAQCQRQREARSERLP
jgi:hypothetical protein